MTQKSAKRYKWLLSTASFTMTVALIAVLETLQH